MRDGLLASLLKTGMVAAESDVGGSVKTGFAAERGLSTHAYCKRAGKATWRGWALSGGWSLWCLTRDWQKTEVGSGFDFYFDDRKTRVAGSGSQLLRAPLN
jgi:hypothetical protein